MNIEDAQYQINRILSKLEAETGSVVKSLELSRIETTSVSDTSAHFAVTSVIEMERLPSQNWDF